MLVSVSLAALKISFLHQTAGIMITGRFTYRPKLY